MGEKGPAPKALLQLVVHLHVGPWCGAWEKSQGVCFLPAVVWSCEPITVNPENPQVAGNYHIIK